MKTNWEKEFEKLLSKYESYAPTWVFNFISKQLQQAKQEGIEEAIKEIEEVEIRSDDGSEYMTDDTELMRTEIVEALSELKKKEGP